MGLIAYHGVMPLVQDVQASTGMLEQAGAGFSQLHTPGGAFQQLDLKRLLQRANPTTGSGQWNPKPLGARCHTSSLDDRYEYLHRVEIHTPNLSFMKGMISPTEILFQSCST
jgi:hypothetical protein